MAFLMFAYPKTNLQDSLHSRQSREICQNAVYTAMKDAGGLSKRQEEGKGEEEEQGGVRN